ncbi:MAG: hypothetical protein ACP6IP_06915 [Candidatus Njordarchaeia archaeon]
MLSIIISFLISLSITYLLLGDLFYMSSINMAKFILSSLIMFLFATCLYFLLALISTISKETLSTLSTYYIIIFFMELISPSIFLGGKWPSITTVVWYALGLLSRISALTMLGDVIFLTSLYSIMGVGSLILSFIVMDRIDLY